MTRWLPPALLVLVIFAVYSGSLRAPFLFDDEGAVVRNPTVRDLWSWQVLHPPADGSTTTGRPLLNLSYALNYALSGEDVWSYHAVNVGIHALTALLLLGMVRRTIERVNGGSPGGNGRNASRLPAARSTVRKSGQADRATGGPPHLEGAAPGDATVAAPVVKKHAQWLAFAVAGLWALHPLQTETVISIAQRSEGLCSLFYLLTLYAFVRGSETGGALVPQRGGASAPTPTSRSWLIVSVIACLAGMASKEIMATAPIVVLLYDRTFAAGSFAGAWRQRRAYYTALASTWVLLGWLVVRGAGARGASAGMGLGVSWWDYLLTQARALTLYLKLAVWPHPLVLDYGAGLDHSLAAVWWQGLVVLSLLLLTVLALVRRPVAGFVGAWFFLLLGPSSSVIPLVTQTIAEHRMYLALVGVVVTGVWAVGHWGAAKARGVLAVLGVVYGALTVARVRDYADGLTLWTDTVEKFPTSARAHNNLGLELDRRGRSAEALNQFARAVAIDPRYVSAYYNWGLTLLGQGRVPDAVQKFESAVGLAPGHADAQLALGNALMRAGAAADAVPHYEAALAAAPGAPDAHYNLGVALVEAGRAGDAVTHLRIALQDDPNRAETHYQLGRAHELLGEREAAERRYIETIQLDPNHVGAHRKLGLLLARREQLDAAAEHFGAVLRLEPGDADTQANLGNVFLLQGRTRDAIAHYEESLRLRPDDARTRENLRLAREAQP